MARRRVHGELRPDTERTAPETDAGRWRSLVPRCSCPGPGPRTRSRRKHAKDVAPSNGRPVENGWPPSRSSPRSKLIVRVCQYSEFFMSADISPAPFYTRRLIAYDVKSVANSSPRGLQVHMTLRNPCTFARLQFIENYPTELPKKRQSKQNGFGQNNSGMPGKPASACVHLSFIFTLWRAANRKHVQPARGSMR